MTENGVCDRMSGHCVLCDLLKAAAGSARSRYSSPLGRRLATADAGVPATASLTLTLSPTDSLGDWGDRITKLRNSGKLEDAAISVLKELGEVKRPYLTLLEEKLLGFLEQEYRMATN